MSKPALLATACALAATAFAAPVPAQEAGTVASAQLMHALRCQGGGAVTPANGLRLAPYDLARSADVSAGRPPAPGVAATHPRPGRVAATFQAQRDTDPTNQEK